MRTEADNLLALAFIGIVILLFFVLLGARFRLPLKRLIVTALLLRIVGSIAYYYLIETVYGGGDYDSYYRVGLSYAERMWNFDWSMFSNSSEWLKGEWWGTQFVLFPAGMVIAVTGANILSTFIVFSLLAFAGLIAISIAFKRSFPQIPADHYARWIWLFPSLWFWSAALGKDALLLFGLGSATLGFIGKKDRIQWPLLVGGIFIVFGLRPQVAALLIFAMLMAFWTSTRKVWMGKNMVQGVVLGLFGFWLIQTSMSNVAGGTELDTVYDYVETKADVASTHRGGSSVEVARGWSGVPLGITNVLFRPLPWEARNIPSLMASLEIYGMWIVLLMRRRSVVRALREWRSHRLLCFGLIFCAMYTVGLGMQVVNLGIIARQRMFLFPFLFLFLEAEPKVVAVPKRHEGELPGRTFVRGTAAFGQRPSPSPTQLKPAR